MAKNLVIVESPAKAKTIEGFLGKDYTVKSSLGHVMDLDSKKLSVDVEHDFEPQYQISPDKKKLVSELKKMAKSAETVWLASDEDREGEAISWHLIKALKLDEEKSKRIVFHEITKSAILNAIENPRGIDHNLVMAQQARRVLDRLVGYELSPLLWRKVKPSLSAGRVQSVAVRLIVEREEEIKKFKSVSSFRTLAEFRLSDEKDTTVFTAEYAERFKTYEEAKAFIEKQAEAVFQVLSVEKKPGKKSPAPPFTTSTLQQEASRKLGMSVANTMRVAQRLYESGKITYMRTDSVNLSKQAIAAAKAEITSRFGEEYVKTRRYTTKSKGAQEAHEAIRPTYLDQQTISGTPEEQRLYELIWKRTVASQMSDAVLEKTQVKIQSSAAEKNFLATGEVVKFDGFLKVYRPTTDETTEEKQEASLLPAMTPGDALTLIEMRSTETFTKHPPRYTEASLVRKMEELGIGRPSTYAPTISTIQKREYVVKESRPGEKRNIRNILLKNGKVEEKITKENTGTEKAKLFPTDIGVLVNRFLQQYFDDIIDYNFTSNVEKEFDEIAEGKKVWNHIIKEFYGPFHEKVQETLKNSGKFSGERLLGKDPKTGKNVYAKIGRYGAIVQIGDTESDDKPRFAGLQKGQSVETITLEEALKLFEYPRHLGEYEGEEVTVAIGRFGPYVKHNKLFYSIKKEYNPASLTLEEAIQIIEAKRKAEREKIIKTFPEDPDVQVLNGRWGPYLVIKKQNYKIPKGTDAASLTLEDCYAIAKDPKNMPKKRYTRKKK
ncbi:type I DNA topoisomerase [Candidatus Sulfidibacterium hydrothermale]|uniref:type I DNA topoisomerase n=1 Tax=Candidatus Sulfidibacterium hydrothermale TaxID=2875962 RepID=UPI001F0ABEC5|nr:type I DNA topoisomerase [Candidatus Sulfidibacterium hydrothermale]UBM62393.1 type I DNA topoisomerase [Candidatus Sulfidibacterium hydrothermale]